MEATLHCIISYLMCHGISYLKHDIFKISFNVKEKKFFFPKLSLPTHIAHFKSPWSVPIN